MSHDYTEAQLQAAADIWNMDIRDAAAADDSDADGDVSPLTPKEEAALTQMLHEKQEEVIRARLAEFSGELLDNIRSGLMMGQGDFSILNGIVNQLGGDVQGYRRAQHEPDSASSAATARENAALREALGQFTQEEADALVDLANLVDPDDIEDLVRHTKAVAAKIGLLLSRAAPPTTES